MNWKQEFKELKEDTDLYLPDGSRIELLYPALIFIGFALVLITVFSIIGWDTGMPV